MDPSCTQWAPPMVMAALAARSAPTAQLHAVCNQAGDQQADGPLVRAPANCSTQQCLQPVRDAPRKRQQPPLPSLLLSCLIRYRKQGPQPLAPRARTKFIWLHIEDPWINPGMLQRLQYLRQMPHQGHICSCPSFNCLIVDPDLYNPINKSAVRQGQPSSLLRWSGIPACMPSNPRNPMMG